MRAQLKLALRVLGRRKFFTFISLFGIAMTLVVLVVAVAMLDDSFAPHPPQSRFDRVLLLTRVEQSGPEATSRNNPGYGFLRSYVLNIPNVERTAAATEISTTAVYRGASRIDVLLKRSDANYWRILDFRFVAGRAINQDDVDRGAPVVVITDTLRRKLFDGASAVGRSFDLDGQRYSVIGVVRAVSITRLYGFADAWTPITTLRGDWRREFTGNFEGYVLARRAADLQAIQRDFAARMKHVPVDDPKIFREVAATLDTAFEAASHEIISGPGARKLEANAPAALRLILFIAAVVFMTLPALNLVTLNLSRILERASEIGVRKAFGASRRALVAQFVMENVVLTIIGGLCAIVLAAVALAAINRSGFIPDAQFALNWRVFLAGLLLAAFFGVFSGVYPAWRMSRLEPVNALRGGAK
jgi:putative ABC transport system permease protein